MAKERCEPVSSRSLTTTSSSLSGWAGNRMAFFTFGEAKVLWKRDCSSLAHALVPLQPKLKHVLLVSASLQNLKPCLTRDNRNQRTCQEKQKHSQAASKRSKLSLVFTRVHCVAYFEKRQPFRIHLFSFVSEMVQKMLPTP